MPGRRDWLCKRVISSVASQSTHKTSYLGFRNLKCGDYSTACRCYTTPLHHGWGHLAGSQGISDLPWLQIGVDIQADVCFLNNQTGCLLRADQNWNLEEVQLALVQTRQTETMLTARGGSLKTLREMVTHLPPEICKLLAWESCCALLLHRTMNAGSVMGKDNGWKFANNIKWYCSHVNMA